MTPAQNAYRYDGSFDGFLCVVFEAFRRRERPAEIGSGPGTGGLFGSEVEIQTEKAHADRVALGIAQKGGPSRLEWVYHAFQSDLPGREAALFRLVETLFGGGADRLDDFRDDDVRAAEKMVRLTRREVHRMHAFVRFEETTDGQFIAEVEPEADVLPLIGEHFGKRYPAMRWAVVDVSRGRALLHRPAADAPLTERLAIVPASEVHAERVPKEMRVQEQWQTYFRSVTIPERANPKLHLRHMPRRYWRHLPEKRPAVRLVDTSD
jgi:probable DNA metabolism protein